MNKLPFRVLFQFLNIDRRAIAIIITYAIVIGFFSLSIPIAVQNLVNSVAFGSVLLPIFVLSFIVFVGLGLSGFLKLAQRFVVEMVSLNVFYHTTLKMGLHLSRAKEEALDFKFDRSYSARFLEVFSIQKNVTVFLVDALEFILVVGSGMLIVALYHPAFLVFDVLLALALYYTVAYLGGDGVVSKKKESDRKYDTLAWIMNLARPAVAIRDFKGAELARKRTEELGSEFVEYRKKHFYLLMKKYTGLLVIGIMASTLLLGVGGFLVFRNQLSLGQLVAAEIILAGVLGMISKLDKIIENYYNLVASVYKIESLFEIPTESSDQSLHKISRIKGSLEFNALEYHFPNRKTLWSPISHSFPMGSKVAILGASGAGKSTFLECIYGMRLPTGGSIRMDGFDYKDIDMHYLRDRIGYAGKFEALPNTLKANLEMGATVNFEKMVSLAKDLLLEDVIQNLPNGYQTQLDTSMLPFSDGQLARLSLLRALLHSPDLLLVDEILDELDPYKKGLVIQKVFEHMKGKTVMVVTHDESITREFDCILSLPSGKVSGGVQ
jgi:putative ABC transport system ATP-binding protein